MGSTKPILFVDFDGTICHDKYWRSLSPGRNEQIQNLLFRADMTRVKDWMLGAYTAEEINHFVADETGVPFAELWDVFVHDCATMHVSQEVLNRLAMLRDTYTVILVTGNMDSFSRFTVPALRLEDYFDCISNSYDEGRHKTDDDGAIFVAYAAKHQVALTQCIVIDDSRDACSVFEKLGGTSFLVTPKNDVTHYLSKLETLRA